MASLLGTLHFWTLKEDILINDLDIGCYKTYEKKENVDKTSLCDKQLFAEGRGIVWIPRNKRPEKLRDCLKELEELQSSQRCVTAKWDKNHIQLVYNNGIIVTLKVTSEYSSIDQIIIDQYLVGKLISDHVVDIIIEEKFLVISYVEPKLTYVYFGKSSSDKIKRADRLTSLEPKLVVVDLVGPMGRRLERKLSISSSKEWVLVWWHIGIEEVWPWMPVNSDRDRASMAVYVLNGSQIELMCFVKVDGELLYAKFSQLQPNHIFTIEKHATKNKRMDLNFCVYELSKSKLNCLTITTIPIESQLIASSWSPDETKVLISFDDRSLMIYDFLQNNCQTVVTQYVCTILAWDSFGSIVMASSDKGQLQCYDCALSCIKLQLLSDEFSPLKVLEIPDYFRYQPTLSKLLWQLPENTNYDRKSQTPHTTIFLLFQHGPIALLTFSLGAISKGQLTPREIINQYLKFNQVDEATHLLLSLDWNSNSEFCYLCLNKIVQYLFRRPFNQDTEIQLEVALGSFYKPAQPLCDVTILEYRDRISFLARRFFHQLLRHQRLEKAFLLAVDLGNRDLFLDLYYIAQDKGEQILADVALQHADQLDGQSVANESITEESEYEDSTEFSEESSIDEHYNIENGGRCSKNTRNSPKNSGALPKITSSRNKERKNSRSSFHFLSKSSPSEESQWPVSNSQIDACASSSKSTLCLMPEQIIPNKTHQQLPFMNMPTSTNNTDLSDPNEQFVDDTTPIRQTDSYLMYNQESSDEGDLEDTRVKFVHFGII